MESGIPDLLRLDKVPVNFEQNIETDLLETSTFQEATTTQPGVATFNLAKKGFLHSHSKLFLGIRPSATNTRAFLPVNIGIGSVIQRACLRVGNQVINEIDDWAHLHMVKSHQIDNENMVEREQYVTGRCSNQRFLYRELLAGVMTFPTNDSQFTGLDNGREYSTNGENLQSQAFANMNVNALSECPVYSIDLSDLFPFLSTHSLPLYMIDQELTIELTFSNTLSRACIPGAGDETIPYTIDKNELKFCADHIFYTQNDMMNRYRDANPSLDFSFPDYRLSKTSVLQDAGTGQNPLGTGVVRNIGMANRLVSKVLTTITDDNLSMKGLTGHYVSMAPARANPTSNPGAIEYNVRYNDRFEYPIDLSNPAQIFSTFTSAESLLFVNREQYSNQQGGIGGSGTGNNTVDFEANEQSTGLAAKAFFLGTRLTNGRVGQRGIELHYKGQDYVNGTYTIRSYSEYMRIARLSNGGFTIMNV